MGRSARSLLGETLDNKGHRPLTRPRLLGQVPAEKGGAGTSAGPPTRLTELFPPESTLWSETWRRDPPFVVFHENLNSDYSRVLRLRLM